MKKSKPKKFRSTLSEVIHETASDLHRAGLIDNASFRELVQGQGQGRSEIRGSAAPRGGRCHALISKTIRRQVAVRCGRSTSSIILDAFHGETTASTDHGHRCLRPSLDGQRCLYTFSIDARFLLRNTTETFWGTALIVENDSDNTFCYGFMRDLLRLRNLLHIPQLSPRSCERGWPITRRSLTSATKTTQPRPRRHRFASPLYLNGSSTRQKWSRSFGSAASTHWFECCPLPTLQGPHGRRACQRASGCKRGPFARDAANP
jgi:hypothetical protein